MIHTVVPIYGGRDEDAGDLRNCYWNSLELAAKNDIHTLMKRHIRTIVRRYRYVHDPEMHMVPVSRSLLGHNTMSGNSIHKN